MDVWGFVLWRAAGSVIVFPVTADVEYGDGRRETLRVREGAVYSSGVIMRRVWLTAAGAGATYVDVARHQADLIVPSPAAPLTEARDAGSWAAGQLFDNLHVEDGFFGRYVGAAVYSPPAWARSLVLYLRIDATALPGGGALNAGVDLCDVNTGARVAQLGNISGAFGPAQPNLPMIRQLGALGPVGGMATGNAAHYDQAPSAPQRWGLRPFVSIGGGAPVTLNGGGLSFFAHYWGPP